MDREEQLRNELEAIRNKVSKWKKLAEENERYRTAFENRVNRNAKDSVFLNLFSIPKYQMAIYRIEKDLLRKYLTDHRTEVQQIMFEMYNPANVAAAERKTEIYDAEIEFGRSAGLSDEVIADLLVRQHGITPTYAMNLVKCEPSKDTVLAV